jgi:hypothetical protein
MKIFDLRVFINLKIKEIITMLKFPPIKPQKLPQTLIYSSHVKCNNLSYRTATMFDTKTGKRCCFMAYIPAITYLSEEVRRSLYISFLNSYTHDRGYGTQMLNFARKCSQREGCYGNIHLSADWTLLPERIPHIFYKKYGMNSGDKKTDKKLDKFIKKGKDATYKDFRRTPMYYPPMKYPKTKGFLNKLKDIFFK